ncbi:MAG TPA: DUF6632 domain-containing protein [Terriglobales bacterium]|nr:DUF6632 domain-containing protein [Terriglobales bacterium]
MVRERALKVVLIMVGLIFVATAYPLAAMPLPEVLQMVLSVYATLGVFLLLASRNPAAHRSLIAFTAWSSFAHAAVVVAQSKHNADERMHLLAGSAALIIIGIAFVALAPASSAMAEARSQ